MAKKRGSYFVRLKVHSERHETNLETADEGEAAVRARLLYNSVVDRGWVGGIKHYEGEFLKDKRALGVYATYGEVCDAHVKGGSGSRGTREAQSRNLLNLVSGVLGVPMPDANQCPEAYEAWREEIRSLPMGAATDQMFQDWRSDAEIGEILDPVSGEPIALATINRKLRQLRSVFGKKSLPALRHLVLPAAIPGLDLPHFRVEKVGYIPLFEPSDLLERGLVELFPNDVELYKILLLALVFGLRRGEVDRLTWRAFDFEGNRLRLSAETLRRLKCDSSRGELPVDPEVGDFFKGMRGGEGPDVYVVKRPRGGNVANRKLDALADRNGSISYRANSVFDRLIRWLKERGVRCDHPIHQLRKAFGWDICIHEGIHAASRALRHSNIRVTEESYMCKAVSATASYSSAWLPARQHSSTGGDLIPFDPNPGRSAKLPGSGRL